MKNRVCYVVPAVAAIFHGVMRKKVPSLKNNPKQRWLNLLLIGAAIFGVVDHPWNGKLFLIGKNVVSDFMLGFTIIVAVFAVWGIFVLLEKIPEKSKVEQIS